MFGMTLQDWLNLLWFLPIFLVVVVITPYTKTKMRAKRDALIEKHYRDTFK